MKFTHALATAAATISTTVAGVAIGAAPADAAPKVRKQPLPCTYVLDEAAGTIAGECHGSTPLGTVDAVFSGTYTDGSASGSFTVDTWLWDFSGSFSGTGFDSGSASGSYTVLTPFGTVSGSFSALEL